MINLGNDWFIDCDDYAFTVKRRTYVEKGKTKGQIRWEAQTWHSTWNQLRTKVVELQMKELINSGSFDRAFTLLDNFVLQEKEIKALVG